MPYIARNLSKFSSAEVKKAFDTAILRKNQDGLHLVVSPRQKEFGRILVITPRKSGNSPARNRIRRQLKALFYQEKLYEQPYDILVLVSKDGIRKSSDELKVILLQASESAKTLKS